MSGSEADVRSCQDAMRVSPRPKREQETRRSASVRRIEQTRVSKRTDACVHFRATREHLESVNYFYLEAEA